MSNILGIDRKTLRTFAQKFQPEGRCHAIRLFFREKKRNVQFIIGLILKCLREMAKVFGTSRDTVRRNARQFGNDADKIQIQENKEVITKGNYKILLMVLNI